MVFWIIFTLLPYDVFSSKAWLTYYRHKIINPNPINPKESLLIKIITFNCLKWYSFGVFLSLKLSSYSYYLLRKNDLIAYALSSQNHWPHPLRAWRYIECYLLIITLLTSIVANDIHFDHICRNNCHYNYIVNICYVKMISYDKGHYFLKVCKPRTFETVITFFIILRPKCLAIVVK